MKSIIRFGLVCFVFCLGLSQSRAAETAALLGTPGKQLFADTFDRTGMAPKWHVGKGFWSVKDGMFIATENPADSHPAYASLAPGFAYKDVIVDFSAKLDGGRACSVMFCDKKYKGSHAGHITAASIQKGKVGIADQKFGNMRNEFHDKMLDPSTTAQEKQKMRESINDKSAEFKVAADMTQWHAVHIELVGDEMLVSVDGKPAGYLKSEGIAHPTKDYISFMCGGKSVNVKDVKVFEATLSPAWSSQRSAVIASLGK